MKKVLFVILKTTVFGGISLFFAKSYGFFHTPYSDCVDVTRKVNGIIFLQETVKSERKFAL